MNNKELLQYITDNVKSFHYQKYQIIGDGIWTPPNAHQSLEQARLSLARQEKYVAAINNVKESIDDISKLDINLLKCIFHWMDHPEHNDVYGGAFYVHRDVIHSGDRPTSESVLLKANIRAAKIKLWESAQEQFAVLIKEMEGK